MNNHQTIRPQRDSA